MTGTLARALALSFFLVSVALRAPGQTTPTRPSDQSYTVIYTGRLFGYFRYPDVQTLNVGDQSGCPTPQKKDLEPESLQAFRSVLAEAKRETKGTPLLVAVGDNFAPFLLARQVWGPVWDEQLHNNERGLVPKESFDYLEQAEGQKDGQEFGWQHADRDEASKHGHKVEYKQVLEGKGTVPMDNVGCFLQLMKFDAIVPGKHDFYFGPERLRQLARFLRTENRTDKGYGTVRMLGANLSLHVRPVDPTRSLADLDPPPAAPPDRRVRPRIPKLPRRCCRRWFYRGCDPCGSRTRSRSPPPTIKAKPRRMVRSC
jgi:hypothetical protein